jgi:hypothetical protein
MTESARKLKKQIGALLKSSPGFTGVGIGGTEARPVVRVYTRAAGSEAEQKLRAAFPSLRSPDDIPIEIEVIGEVRLQT